MLLSELKETIQQNKLPIEKATELENSVEQYPYSAILQQLAYFSLQQKNLKDDAQLAGLYKTNPYLFAVNKSSFGIEDKIMMASSDLETEHLLSINTELKEFTEEPNLVLTPFSSEDYFRHQGVKASETEIEQFVATAKEKAEKVKFLEESETSQLLITRSFQDWLDYFKEKREKEQKENEDKLALKAMWQKEKLSMASEEENDVVPEQVFKMAIDSLNLSESTNSESLADILVKQGKFARASEMFRKLSLQNPEKSAYFAAKIKEIKNK
jgi:hypothetical protein